MPHDGSPSASHPRFGRPMKIKGGRRRLTARASRVVDRARGRPARRAYPRAALPERRLTTKAGASAIAHFVAPELTPGNSDSAA